MSDFKMGWDKARRFLSKLLSGANSWTGTQTFSNATISTNLIVSSATASLPVFTGTSKELVTKSVADTLTALGLTDAIVYKGVIDCSGNPNYPAADAGHAYIVSVAGKIGGASGTVVTAGDMVICNTDSTASGDQATVGNKWNVIEKNIDLTNISITGGSVTGLTSLSTTTANVDHIAEKTGSHGVVFDNIASSAYEIYDTHYDTIFIPASAMTSTATNGAVISTTEYATNDINMDYLLFDGATEQYAEFQFPMPENWDRSTIKAKFFWSSDSGSTANDTVEWEIAGGALSNDDAIDAALGTAQVISDALLANNGTDLQVSGATPALTVGGTPALGDLVHFKVSRNVGGTDDMTENARLFGVWLQYKANTSVASW